jgi:hypothetical protein
MGGVIMTRQATRRSTDAGFTLTEVMFSLMILVFGLLSMAAAFTQGMLNVSTSQADIIAKEKAAEAIESIYAARDTRVIPWAQIRNAVDGGVFLDGAQPMRPAGPDGLVNTGDEPNTVESVRLPGVDGQLGTQDDIVQLLTEFSRDIQIVQVNGNPNLRRVTIVIAYRVGAQARTYTLNGFVSEFA